MTGRAAPGLEQRLDEALSLARQAQNERAQACADLAQARHDLREARLDLGCARELLAYHGLTPIEEDDV